jgi:hypothetical protein
MSRCEPPKQDRSAEAPAADRRGAERDARLAAALRANLRRRKAQARARHDAPEGDPRSAPSTDADDVGRT